MHRHFGNRFLAALIVAATMTVTWVPVSCAADEGTNQVLEWNQILIDSLIQTNAVNAASPRLSAIVHTAIFDAYNGIERRYTPIYVQDAAPRGASRRAAVIAAAYTTLRALFKTRLTDLDASYVASLAALTDDPDDDGGRSRELGIAWGVQVANAVLAWRATDGFNVTYPGFGGGTAVGQWRVLPPNVTMASQALAFTQPFVLTNSTQFRPPAPRGLLTSTYVADFTAVKSLGRASGSPRTDDQSALALFWDGNPSVHWNQAANQMARANGLSISNTNRLFAVLNIAMADTMFTTWAAKRHYAASDTEVTWRPITAITLGEFDSNPQTAGEPTWAPFMNTPSHPEYPAGHPSQNGAGAAVLLTWFDDAQTFTLTTRTSAGLDLPQRTYSSILQARSDGNNARIWGGMHYPSTVAVSDQLGESIANYINQHGMQRVHGGE
jgi:hypothetical protein